MGMKRRSVKSMVHPAIQQDITGEWVCVALDVHGPTDCANGTQPKAWWYREDKVNKQV
jgi:hypothetical protein